MSTPNFQYTYVKKRGLGEGYLKVAMEATRVDKETKQSLDIVRLLTKSWIPYQETPTRLTRLEVNPYSVYKEYCIQKELADQIPGIVQVYDCYVYMGKKGVNRVEAYVEKCDQTLDTAMQSGLTFQQKMKIASDLAATIASMHERGYAHGDIHKQNVLLKDFNVKITDFGSTRKFGEEGSINRLLLAPEQTISCLGTAVTEKTDVYQMGLFLQDLFAEEMIKPDLISAALHEDPSCRPTMAQIRDSLRN
ncbi:MAG: protein kinase family protein [Verrucomicrobia bacterium]|nr:protein kinase family protein [Verrucomicrobiota bacterium]